MVPDSFTDYFVTSATAAGALIGLLFVAVALRPDTVFGPNAPTAGRMLAGSAFTGLVNAFFLSLIATIPQVNLGYAAIVLAGSSIYATIRLQILGGRERNWRLLVLALLAYVGQAISGVLLVIDEHRSGPITTLCYVVVAAYAASIGRAWALLRGEHLVDRTSNSSGGTDGTAE